MTMITRVTLSATRPTFAPLLMPSSLTTLRKTVSPSTATSLSKLGSSSPCALPILSAATCLPLPRHRQAVRFHRTDYDGPGHFDKRETGAMLGAPPPRDAGDHHDHAHRHQQQEQQPQPAKDDDETRQLRQLLEARYNRRSGTYSHRGYTVGIGGPVGSGKTALTLALCRALRDRVPIGVVTNDIFTQEDAEFLGRQEALPPSRIVPVETGGCPHAAIREDVSANLGALELLTRRIARERAAEGQGGSAAPPLLLCESGGDNLAANFSSELADYTIYVIDVAGGDKIPRKGGPGITQSDLLVINKIDLAEAVGADLTVMDRDARNMRKGMQGDTSGPTIFASVKNGVGTKDIIEHILQGFEKANELVEIAG